jgi:hemoglobin-like flavoprotein
MDPYPTPSETPDIALIRQSFRAVAGDPEALAASFYRHLFAAEPALRGHFAADLAPQQSKLAAMLAAVVAGLHDWAALAPAVAALGRRHAALGVEPAQYAPVGRALLAALDERAGRPLDPATRAAWLRAYARLADAMIAAGKPAEDPVESPVARA